MCFTPVLSLAQHFNFKPISLLSEIQKVFIQSFIFFLVKQLDFIEKILPRDMERNTEEDTFIFKEKIGFSKVEKAFSLNVIKIVSNIFD